MQPLKLNQKFLTLVGLCAPADDVSIGKIVLYTAVGLYVFVTLWSDLISSSFFLIQYKIRDMEDVLGSMLQTAAVTSNIVGMASTLLLSKRLRGVFLLFQTIYNECSRDKSYEILIETEEKSRRVTRILVIKYVTGLCVLSVTLATLNITGCYLTEHELNVDCLYTPYKHILPWNDDTFIGWFYGLLCSFWMSGTYFFMNCIFLSCFLSIGFNFEAFPKHFDYLLSQITEANSKNTNFNEQTRVALHRAIDFHNMIKQLFNEIKEVYSGIIFAQLVCGTWFIAASLFQMDMAARHLDVYFSSYFNSAALSITNLYLYCYSGASATENCLKYSDMIFEKDWYLMPIDHQKSLIHIIQNANKSLVFTGYDIISLNLEIFLSILKSVMSYYLMFKTLIG